MTEPKRSSVTFTLKHKTIKPADIGSPLSRKMESATYQPTPDPNLMNSLYTFLDDNERVVDEVVYSTNTGEGYTKITVYLKQEAPSKLVESFIALVAGFPIEFSVLRAF